MKIIIKQTKIHKNKIFKSFNKIQKHLFYLAKIELILFLIIFVNILPSLFQNYDLRKLQSYGNYNNNNYNNYNSQGNSGYTTSTGSNTNNVKKADSYEPMNPVIIIFFVFFVLFLVLCLYLICEIKNIAPERIAEFMTENVYKFIYMANSGFFFTAICYSPMINDLSVGYLTLGASGIIFIIGSIILLKNLVRDTGGRCFTDFTILDKLKNYFRIPCDYVWPFIGLTDPCCETTTYTVTTYSDGTTTSTKSCVECWNCFVLVVKRIVLILSTILFYCFLIFLSVIFLIIKLIYLLVTQSNKCCQSCKADNQNANPNIPTNNVIISNNGNLQSQQNLENRGINPSEQKQDSAVQLGNQIANNIVKNQVLNPNITSTERLNANNQTNNHSTKLVIKDGNNNNLPAPEIPNPNIDKNDIINIKNKEN